MKNLVSMFITSFFLVACIVLIACGGGGSDDNDGNGNSGPPPTAPSENFGSIRGSVESAGGSPLNAVHVRAVNVNNTNIQISNFSGIAPNFSIIDGFFQIDRVPPGTYRILIEKLDGRSSVFGATIYSDFVEDQNPLIAFPDEYFNGSGESSSDDPEDFVVISVVAGQVTTGIDFITNN